MGPVILFCLIYIGGLIGQFIGNYSDWQAAGGRVGDGTFPSFPAFDFGSCVRSVFRFPYGIYGVLVCLILLFLLFCFVMKLGYGDKGELDRERNFTISRKGTYGTAGFMTDAEIEEVLEVTDVKRCSGIILGERDGKVIALPNSTYLNKNIAVYGASGSMKSRAYSRNACLQAIKRGESFICTDPKSELYEDMAAYAESCGYTTRVFNLVSPENSDAWNALREVEGEEMLAQVFTDVVMQNTGSEKTDRFWDSGEAQLLKALILFVEYVDYPDKEKTFQEVYRLLTAADASWLKKQFASLDPSSPPAAPYAIYQQASETVRNGILMGLGTRLQLLQNQAVKNVLSRSEIDLTLPGQKKCAYFVVLSDQDTTWQFISSLFFSFLFIKLVRYADRHGENGQLPVPVNIIADELNSIGKIVDLPIKISTCRSRNIAISCIFQNLAQLQNRYPLNEWQEILGNCDTTLFLGCTDPLTAQFISDRSGDLSVSVNSNSKMLGSWRISNYTPEYRETSSVGKRKLLNMDEVMRMPMEECLIILRGQKVAKAHKFDYTGHPDAKKLVKRKASSHVPEWRQQYRSMPQHPSIEEQVIRSVEKPVPASRRDIRQVSSLESPEQQKKKPAAKRPTPQRKRSKPTDESPYEQMRLETVRDEIIGPDQNHHKGD